MESESIDLTRDLSIVPFLFDCRTENEGHVTQAVDQIGDGDTDNEEVEHSPLESVALCDGGDQDGVPDHSQYDEDSQEGGPGGHTGYRRLPQGPVRRGDGGFCPQPAVHRRLAHSYHFIAS